MAVVLDQDNENVKEMMLCFKDRAGVEHTWDMKAHTHDSLSYEQWGSAVELGRDYFFLLPDEVGVDIDFNQPIIVQRKGKLSGMCR
ncbi:MAG: hypothetical protein V8R91_07580 [Butyricimonas faecihominis]